jgi:hypothetical protein
MRVELVGMSAILLLAKLGMGRAILLTLLAILTIRAFYRRPPQP